MKNIINALIKTHHKALNEKYNQFPYQNPVQSITMRNIIYSLKTPIARLYNEKYNQLIPLSKPIARHYD